MRELKLNAIALAVWAGSIVLSLVVGVTVARATDWETLGQVVTAATMTASMISGFRSIIRNR